jgi:hypothetical protein
VGQPFFVVVFQSWILSGSYYRYWSYYKYCSDLRWIILFIFITALLFLLYVLFEKKVDRTVNFYYFTALPIIRTVLTKQACNIYKYWSYNRNLRVVSFIQSINFFFNILRFAIKIQVISDIVIKKFCNLIDFWVY